MGTWSVGDGEKGTLHLSRRTLQKHLPCRPLRTKAELPPSLSPSPLLSADEPLLSKLLRTERWGDTGVAGVPNIGGTSMFSETNHAAHTRQDGGEPGLTARLCAAVSLLWEPGRPAALFSSCIGQWVFASHFPGDSRKRVYSAWIAPKSSGPAPESHSSPDSASGQAGWGW